MFKIGKDEVKAVQKLAPKNKLKVLSRRKNSRGHTYLVLDDDYDTLHVLSSLRGKSIRDILADEYRRLPEVPEER